MHHREKCAAWNNKTDIYQELPLGYLIALVIISMVLAPVLWIMPTPKQKRQMALRQKAMAMGLQVRVCDLPQTHRAQVRGESPVQGVVYRMLWFRTINKNSLFEHLCLREPDESEYSKKTLLDSLLLSAVERLPKCVVALEYTHSGLGIYWTEQGGIAQVDIIYQQLMTLKNEIVAASE